MQGDERKDVKKRDPVESRSARLYHIDGTLASNVSVQARTKGTEVEPQLLKNAWN